MRPESKVEAVLRALSVAAIGYDEFRLNATVSSGTTYETSAQTGRSRFTDGIEYGWLEFGSAEFQRAIMQGDIDIFVIRRILAVMRD